jgi:hypothetical protein
MERKFSQVCIQQQKKELGEQKKGGEELSPLVQVHLQPALHHETLQLQPKYKNTHHYSEQFVFGKEKTFNIKKTCTKK